MGDWLFGWVYDLLYTLQKSICYLLDFIRDVFCKLAGIETINIDGSGQEEILTHFITSAEIRNGSQPILRQISMSLSASSTPLLRIKSCCALTKNKLKILDRICIWMQNRNR